MRMYPGRLVPRGMRGFYLPWVAARNKVHVFHFLPLPDSVSEGIEAIKYVVF